MRLVHEVEDDMVIGFEFVTEVRPPSLEGGSAGNGSTVVDHEVVRIYKCKSSLAGDIIDDRFQTAQIGGVEGSSQTSRRRAQPFHQERNAECVEPCTDEVIDAARGRPGIVCAQGPRDDSISKFSAGLVDAEVRKLSARPRADAVRRRGCRTCGGR